MYLTEPEFTRALGNLTLELQPTRNSIALMLPKAAANNKIVLPEDDVVDAIALLHNGNEWLASLRVGQKARRVRGGGVR